MFGLIEEMKGVGKQKIWDLQLYRSLDGIERVFCQRNDKPEVYTWVDEEDVAYVINYAWVFNCYIHYRYYNIFLHKVVMNATACVIDHINHVVRDNTKSNLRSCGQQENQRNRFSLNYHYDRYQRGRSRFKVRFVTPRINGVSNWYSKKELGLRNLCFVNEREVLIAASTVKFDSFDYDIKNDFSKHPEYLEAYYKGEYSFEEAQRRLMMHYADNIIYWFRFDLFDYYKSIGVEEPEWSEDFEGYLIDKDGNRFCKMLE